MICKRAVGIALTAVLGVGGVFLERLPSVVQATTTLQLLGPAGSEMFGERVLVLGNGNFVVADSKFDLNGVADVGAVYLYSGATNQQITAVTGSSAGDGVGSGGIVALGTSNFAILSPLWDNANAADAGAFTWVNGSTGLNGQVGASNSLVGSSTGDGVATIDTDYRTEEVVVLANGNVVVRTPTWDNGAAADAGAVTWVSGEAGKVGAVSAANSLVGTSANDRVGEVDVLPNGNYLVRSTGWQASAGAVTWGNGVSGTVGAVSAANSLIGSTPADLIGAQVVILSNSNVVTFSRSWANGNVARAGAATFVSGTGATVGPVSAANSLVGATALDQVSSGDVKPLSNGNYLVLSPHMTIAGVQNAGAATWGNGTSGTTGAVSTSNSLHGSQPGDLVGGNLYDGGWGGVPLSNGNYVVISGAWDAGAVTDVGAVTWGNGATGTVGAVSAANSLVGSTASDFAGNGYWSGGSAPRKDVIPLVNGNYVVISSGWDNGAVENAGAVTWGSGTSGVSGAISATNSVVGTSASPFYGSFVTATALANGNYVVSDSDWQNEAGTSVGAVAVGDGTSGTTGAITAGNSLYGSRSGDGVGFSIVPLSNGNFVVNSMMWANGAASTAGASTWVSGTTGLVGPVSAANSLVGTASQDFVGNGGIVELTNGNYVVSSRDWGSLNYGAVTWGSGTGGVVGEVSAANSLVGSTEHDQVGFSGYDGGVRPLSDGNYVVISVHWQNSLRSYSGAATWGSGTTGIAGAVSSANSLIGSTNADAVAGFDALSDGRYLITAFSWDNGPISDAGAVAFGPAGGVVGPFTAANSAIGTPRFGSGTVVVGSTRFTSAGAIVVATQQNRVLLLQTAPALPPTFAAPPPNVSVQVQAPAVSAVATYPLPTASDSSGPASVNCSPASGSTFQVGVTTVSCMATGSGGLSSFASFTVTVSAVAGATTTTTTAATTTTTIPAATTTTTTIPAATTTSTTMPATTTTTTPTTPTIPTVVPDFVPFVPARLADTRDGQPTTDGLFAGGGARVAGSVFELPVAGRGGVPADAAAVALNVTAVGASPGGHVTVFPCGATQPTASNLNFVAGSIVPNAVVSKIGVGGKVCFFVSDGTHLIIDVNGSFPTASNLVSLNPARLMDTRDQPTVDGLQRNGGIVAAGSVTEIQVTGRAGVPANAVAAVLNVTVTGSDAEGFATVFPCGQEVPATSTLNFARQQTIANLAVSKIGVDGKVCLFAQSPTHAIVDVVGYFSAGTNYQAIAPKRILDTRPGFLTVDGVSQGAGLRPAGSVTELLVAGRGGVAADAATVVLNVTVTNTAGSGFITVFPCGITPPLASNLNFEQDDTVPNAVIVKVGVGGKVCLLNSAATHLIADVNGYFPN